MDRDLVDSQNFGYQNLGKFWQPLIFFSLAIKKSNFIGEIRTNLKNI
jgi:hypothetical protein